MINYRPQKGGMEGNIFILVIQIFRIKNKQIKTCTTYKVEDSFKGNGSQLS